MLDDKQDIRENRPLPKQGMSFDAIKTQLRASELAEPYAHFARAFRGPEDVQAVGYYAVERFQSDNGFFSMYLPYMRKIEQEVIAMGVSLLHPREASTGNFTSGGTESNFSALHAAREWAKDHFPRIERPNIVAPITIHPSLKKAAQYLQIEVITTDIDDRGRAIPANLKAAINDRTIMLAASAPTWHFGRIDPIPEIAQIAESAGLWMHVDACVGGYISPFLEKLGNRLTPWDFRVSGVTSISADLHKYGYCPKPASTIYWREASLQKYHYVAIDDPFLGLYKLAGLSGSRSAGSIFAAWAVMNYLGEEGYLRLTRGLLQMKERLTREINAIDGLHMWDVDVMPLHFHSEKAPTTSIYRKLSEKGWLMLGLVHPEALTIALDPAFTEEQAGHLIADIRDITEDLIAHPEAARGDIRYA